MRKYVFKNATVYITKPTEAQIVNIRKSTERFVHKLAKEGLLDDGYKRRNNRRTRVANIDAGKRDKKIKKKN